MTIRSLLHMVALAAILSAAPVGSASAQSADQHNGAGGPRDRVLTITGGLPPPPPTPTSGPAR